MSECADDARVAFPLFQAEYGGSTPTSALQLHIAKISPHAAIKLNAHWHSRLPKIVYNNIIGTGMHCCFGAEYGNRFYAVAIWSAPIARLLNDRTTLELRRLAVASDAPRNTASRMLAVMRRLLAQRMPHIRKLISYQDTEVHTGGIYKAAGWTAAATNDGGDWVREKRGTTNPSQTVAPKVRWELKQA